MDARVFGSPGWNFNSLAKPFQNRCYNQSMSETKDNAADLGSRWIQEVVHGLTESLKKRAERARGAILRADDGPAQTLIVGAAGQLTVPAGMGQAAGFHDGSHVVVQATQWGLVIVPLSQLIEDYTPERKAEFLLNNAVDEEDYAGAVAAVREMGLDPGKIKHYRPQDVGA